MKSIILFFFLVPFISHARIEEKCATELKNSTCAGLKGLERFACLQKFKPKSEVCVNEIQKEQALFRKLGKPCFNDIQMICKPYGRNDLETCLFNEQERFFGQCKKHVTEVLKFRATP